MNAQKLIDAVIAFRLNPGPVTGLFVLLEADLAKANKVAVPDEWKYAVGAAAAAAKNLEDGIVASPDIELYDEVEIIWPLDDMVGQRGIVTAVGEFLVVRWYSEESTILVDRDMVANFVRAWAVKTVWRRQDHPHLLEAVRAIGDHGEPGKRLQAARYLLAVVSGWPERIYPDLSADSIDAIDLPGRLPCWATREAVLEDARAIIDVTSNPGTSPDGGGAQEGLMPDTDSSETDKGEKPDPKAKKGAAKPVVDVNDERLPEAFRGNQQPAWVEGFLGRLAYKGDDAKAYAATHRVRDAEWQSGWHKCNKLNFGGR